MASTTDAPTNTPTPLAEPPAPPTTSSTQPITPSTSTADTRIPYPFTNTHPPPSLIAQGAEALLYRTTYLSPSTPAALKFRPSKKYRHKVLDERLTKQRVLAEGRVLVKLAGLADHQNGGWTVPAVYAVEWDVGRKIRALRDRRLPPVPAVEVEAEAPGGKAGEKQEDREENKGAWLLMEWIEGVSVKELVRRWDAWARQKDAGGQVLVGEEERREGEEELKGLLRRIGRAVAGMHSKGGVVHGDLTSSNLLVRRIGLGAGSDGEVVEAESNAQVAEGRIPKPDLSGEIVLIDFGLAVQSVQDEDRAVDLYVLERAFGSTHPRQEEWFDQEVLQSQEGYRGAWKGAAVVLKRLEEVRLRGRKRSMIG